MFYKELIKHEQDLGNGGGRSLNVADPDPVDPDNVEQPEDKGAINLDAVKAFVENDPDGRSYLQALNQATIDDAVKSQLELEKETIRQEAILQASNMTPEQIRIQENEAKVAQLERKIQLGNNKTLVMQSVTQMPVEQSVKNHLLAFANEALVTDSAEQTNANMSALQHIITKVTETAKREAQLSSVERTSNSNIKPTLGVQDTQPDGLSSFGLRKASSNLIGEILSK